MRSGCKHLGKSHIMKKSLIRGVYVFLFRICLIFFIFGTGLYPHPCIGGEVEGGIIRHGGVVSPLKRARLSFKVSGVVRSIKEEGSHIKRGESVAAIDCDRYELLYENAKASYDSALISLENARHSRNKTERMMKESILAPIALKEAEFSVASSEAALRQAESRLEISLLDKENCSIAAPFSGVVVKDYVREGEYAGAGSPAIEIADVNDLELVVDLPVGDVARLSVGKRLGVYAGSSKEPVGYAEVRKIMPLLDAGSGLQQVRWRVYPDRQGSILAGEYIELERW